MPYSFLLIFNDSSPKKQQKVYQDLQKSGKICIFAPKSTDDEKNYYTNDSLYGYHRYDERSASDQDGETESD
jgi:hypothetical protein